MRCCALCYFFGEAQCLLPYMLCFKMLRQICILFDAFPNVLYVLLHTYGYLLKVCSSQIPIWEMLCSCKGEEREPVKCLAGIQTHMSSAFFFLVSHSFNFIKRENELGLVWIVITNPCWLQMDPLWFFLNSFLAQNQHRTLSLINETHPVPCLIFKVC